MNALFYLSHSWDIILSWALSGLHVTILIIHSFWRMSAVCLPRTRASICTFDGCSSRPLPLCAHAHLTTTTGSILFDGVPLVPQPIHGDRNQNYVGSEFIDWQLT